MKKPSAKSLQLRKEKLETRLREFGLDSTIRESIAFDETQYSYPAPHLSAERLLILLAVSFTAYNFDESEKVMDWLKKEQLWKSVSAHEKEFFRDPDPGEDEKQRLSWRFEGAYILAWALKMVSSSAEPGTECSKEQVNAFLQAVPTVGSSTEGFLSALHYRSLPEVLDENLFYETATVYFREIVVRDKENTSQVHAKASFERHLALSWLRNAAEQPDWDTAAMNINDI
ncbi:MAG: DUF4272 domain-containing protein [Chitinophagaceae bacterium]|nr:DUF4272 domain-containing protein [Chitinophagaceae bacterium]